MDEIDQPRLDELLNTARRYNHLSYLLASLSLLMTMIGKLDHLVLSYGNIEIPKLHSSITIYFIVILFASISKHFVEVLYPFLIKDKRSIPFAWLPVLSQKPSKKYINLFLVLPILICSIATVINLKQDHVGLSLIILSFFVFLLPKHIHEHVENIRNKADHRGGPATFSIFIYQYYQIFKIILYIFFLYVPILAVIPEWRDSLVRIGSFSGSVILIIVIIRLISGLPVIYRIIDKFGTRFGFQHKSAHYK